MTEDAARLLLEWLKDATKEEIDKFARRLTLEDALALDARFEIWAHRGQIPPQIEGWRVWLMMAGRGFGKTRAGAEWIHRLASGKRGLRFGLVGASISDARSIMVEGVSGMLAVAKHNRSRVTWEPSLGRINGRTEARRNCFRAIMPTGCAARSMISSGRMSSRNGARPTRHG